MKSGSKKYYEERREEENKEQQGQGWERVAVLEAGRQVWPEQNERNGKWENIRLERCENLQVF